MTERRPRRQRQPEGFRWFTKYPTFPLRFLFAFYALLAINGIVNPDDNTLGFAIFWFLVTILTRNRFP